MSWRVKQAINFEVIFFVIDGQLYRNYIRRGIKDYNQRKTYYSTPRMKVDTSQNMIASDDSTEEVLTNCATAATQLASSASLHVTPHREHEHANLSTQLNTLHKDHRNKTVCC